jgi:hypothetical protein
LGVKPPFIQKDLGIFLEHVFDPKTIRKAWRHLQAQDDYHELGIQILRNTINPLDLKE